MSRRAVPHTGCRETAEADVTLGLCWKDGRETCAHSYLLPSLVQELSLRRPGRALRVVDLGCGNGAATAAIANLGHQVVGVDVSHDGIEIARRLYSGIRFEMASIYDQDLPERIGAVDCVVSLEVVEHLFYPRRLFEASERLLVEGGLLIVSTPYHGYLKNLALSLIDGWDKHFGAGVDGGHIKFFSKSVLTQMALQGGFREPRFRGVGRAPWLWKSMVLSFEKVRR
jgi:2-polyprenyl-3-methyl-5-hydroxy-6-metoxy-1,4-benzoquinol methylase